jgi:putative transposase
VLQRPVELAQYTGRAFRDACFYHGVIPSVGHTGICFDNAAAESWNATFKKELIHLHAWKGVTHVRQAVFEYVEVYYNRKRIQKELGYLSPSEYELGIDTGMALVA